MWFRFEFPNLQPKELLYSMSSSTHQSKILVPIGFSEQSLLALQQAIVFGKAMKAKLYLLSVIEESSLLSRLLGDGSDSDEKVRATVEEKLQQLAIETRNSSGLEVEYLIAKGTVYEEIAKTTELIDADLVVMGTNGRPSNFKKKFIGSNAYRTVTAVKPPVLVVKGVNNPETVKKIIFPVYTDIKSREKTPTVIHYARLFDATVLLIGFFVNDEEKARLLAILKQLDHIFTEAGIKHEIHFKAVDSESKKIDELFDFTYKNGGDVLAITEEGEEPDIATVLLGTEVQKVLYYSEIPVLAITPRRDIYGGIIGS